MESEGSLPSQLSGISFMNRKVKNEYKSLFVKCEGMRSLGRDGYRSDRKESMKNSSAL